MSMRKKRDQEIFIDNVLEVTVKLKVCVNRAKHGFLGWSDFIEKYAEGIKNLQELFEEMGMGGLR